MNIRKIMNSDSNRRTSGMKQGAEQCRRDDHKIGDGGERGDPQPVPGRLDIVEVHGKEQQHEHRQLLVETFL